MRDDPARKLRVAMLTPLPPSKSGVAHYASIVLPALAKQVDVTPFATLDGYSRAGFDAVVYQLGNNPHHEEMYLEAMREPGVIVLHDLVLHHLIVELTLARGDAEGYVRALEANHGAAGAAWARGRASGLHSEMGNFLLPASIDVANRSRAVIVHNRYAAERLKSFGVTTPVHVVPHPFVDDDRAADRDRVRARLGLDPSQRVIGFFGFVTSAKRGEVVLQAFAEARRRDPRLVLLVVGEAAPNIDPSALQGDGVIVTGYVSDEEFGGYYAAADRLVNLRYPTAGESSGTLVRAFAAGKPVAVSDYAQFAEFPDSCVARIPFVEDEIERLADFFIRELDVAAIAKAQRRWLHENARMDLTVEGYLRAIESASREQVSAARATLPLFPALELVGASASRDACRVELRNRGDAPLLARAYDQPSYRLIAKILRGGDVVQDRWLELAGDLAPGATTVLEFPLVSMKTSDSTRETSSRGDATFELRLYHALQQVPMLEPDAWATAEVRVV